MAAGAGKKIIKMVEVARWVYLWLIILYLWPWTQSAAAATAAAAPPSEAENLVSMAKPGCNPICGNISVPYPFGIDNPTCAKDGPFFLNCSRSAGTSPQLFFSNLPILNISTQDSTVIVAIDAAFDCYNGTSEDDHFDQSLSLTQWPMFTVSSTRNKLTAVGCDTLAYMADGDNKFGSGCVSICSQPQKFEEDSTCSGLGCCQTALPENVTTLTIVVGSVNNHTEVSNFSPCSYAFLAETDSFDLSEIQFDSKTPQILSPPVVFDWVVFDQDCGLNADSVHSDIAPGYNCSCRKGYMGNPYLPHPQGCYDIDECKESREKYPCHGTCDNTEGDYRCRCRFGMEGDGKDVCQLARAVKIIAVVGSITFLVIISLIIFGLCKRITKERNFRKNGGTMLKHQRVRLFSKAELDKATNNYDSAQLLGEGGFGSVYRGVLEDNLQIAVKKPKDEIKTEVINKDFHQEIATVSQVNHKNVVKLLGLCLETKVPLLVYEYISNGTLFQHIHDKRSNLLQLWKNRLRVAVETALALDYLHSLADPPIVHRDVKSMNILLDENHTAKVSDFGASVLISPGEGYIATNIQGTMGYLDPEYLMTGILTEKSDVYSFGVVLVELLTGEKPTSNARSGAKRNIIQYFISVAGKNDLFKILGFDVTDEAEKEEIEDVAEIAKRCLDVHGIRRPTMKEVAEDLVRLKKLNDSFWAQQKGTEETESLLLGESSFSPIENRKEETQTGQAESYTEMSFDIESLSMPSI